MKRLIGSVLGLFFLIGFVSWAGAAPPSIPGNPGVPGLLAQIADLTAQVAALQSQLNADDAQISTLNAQIDALNAQIDTLHSQALVARTGQTTSYATGDDGDLEKGVVLPTPRFTDNTNGTITDNLTGLIWLKNANCPNGARNWATALTDVASLNSAGTVNGNGCGDVSNAGSHQTDWRLPNIRELFSLIDFAFNSPALSNAAGTGQGTSSDPLSNFQTTSYYWSSTTSAFTSQMAWFVFFGYIGVDLPLVNFIVVDFDFKGNFGFVLAVRGGS